MLKFQDNGSGYFAKTPFGVYEIDKVTYPVACFRLYAFGGDEGNYPTVDAAIQAANEDFKARLKEVTEMFG